MISLLGLLRDLRRRTARSKTRRRANRSVVLSSPDRKSAQDFARLLLHDTAIAFDSARPVGGDSSPERGDVVDVYVPTRIRRRGLRRWHFAIASGDVSANAEHAWQQEADTVLFVWPSRLLGLPEGPMLERALEIVGPVGAARHEGRLRRAAIVVTQLPPEIAPRAESQARLDLDRRRSFRESIDRSVQNHRGRPGDGLADPRWQHVLERSIASDPGLTRLEGILRQIFGRPCTLFFVPATARPGRDARTILGWIDKRRAPRPPRRVCFKQVAAAAVLIASCVQLTVLGMQALRARSDVLARGPGRQQAELRRRLGAYHHPASALSFAALPGAGAVAALEEALRSVRGPAAREFCQRDLESLIRTIVDSNPRSDEASNHAAHLLLDALQRCATSLHPDKLSIETDGRSFLAAARLAVLLSLRPVADQWSIYESVDGVAELACRSLASVGLESTGVADLAAAARTGQLHARFAAQLASASPANQSLLRSLVPFLPLLDAAGIVQNAAALTFEQACELRPVVGAALSDVLARATISPADSVLTPEIERQAALVAAALDEAVRPHEMVLLFKRLGEESWHVDVRAGTGPFVGGVWLSNEPELEGCAVLLRALRPGDTVTVCLIAESDVHATTRSAQLPCASCTPTQLQLRSAAGRLRLADGREIEYRVVRGWPEWPPAIPGNPTVGG